jgi:hypothetical protein
VHDRLQLIKQSCKFCESLDFYDRLFCKFEAVTYRDPKL